ncbi:hypothetical protein MMC31_003976 [Peltigera leucophlebia]|nr:hypothetical protein [Peltigera leucophlebia]
METMQTISVSTRGKDHELPKQPAHAQGYTSNREIMKKLPKAFLGDMSNVPLPRSVSNQMAAPHSDEPMAIIAAFDTVFIIDDSASMIDANWKEVASTVAAIAQLCTSYNSDGIEIRFLNHRPVYKRIKTLKSVKKIFKICSSTSQIPIGARLEAVLSPYVKEYAKMGGAPLNIIILINGFPTDDPVSVIVATARKLDCLQTLPWQVGIQFIQVGNNVKARGFLEELDDTLANTPNMRDMVDTVMNNNHEKSLSAELIWRTLHGGVNRRIRATGPLDVS